MENGLELGSAIVSTLEADTSAQLYFDFPKPEKILIVEGTTDVELINSYLSLEKISVEFEIKCPSLIEKDAEGKDAAVKYYEENKLSQEIKLLLDQDYDIICNLHKDEKNIFYYDYYELENYIFEDRVLRYALYSAGLESSAIDKVLQFLETDKEFIDAFNIIANLRIFRRLHYENQTKIKLDDAQTRKFAEFLKNIRVKECIIGKDPNLYGDNFQERLSNYIVSQLGEIHIDLTLESILEECSRFINDNSSLINFFRYYFKGKDGIKVIPTFLKCCGNIPQNLNGISSKSLLKNYIFHSELFKEKICTVIQSFSDSHLSI